MYGLLKRSTQGLFFKPICLLLCYFLLRLSKGMGFGDVQVAIGILPIPSGIKANKSLKCSFIALHNLHWSYFEL